MVVAAQQIHVMDIYDLHAHAVVVPYNHIAIQADALREKLPAAEIDDARGHSLSESPQNRIVVIKYNPVVLCLICTDPLLNVNIVFHGSVTV